MSRIGKKPIPVPAVVPADLLGRRADITAARWRIESALGDVKNAKAQFYPNINLTAFIGLNSIGLSRFLKSDSEQYGVGPALRLPIFDSGRLRANLTTGQQNQCSCKPKEAGRRNQLCSH